MLLCRHHAFQRTVQADCPLHPFSSIVSPVLAFACLLRLEQISLLSASNGRCPSSFSLDLHQTTQSFDLPIVFDHCSCSDSDKLSHTATVGPLSSPYNFTCPRPADQKKGGADITPSSLLALLNFCTARSIDHVSDSYSASFLFLRALSLLLDDRDQFLFSVQPSLFLRKRKRCLDRAFLWKRSSLTNEIQTNEADSDTTVAPYELSNRSPDLCEFIIQQTNALLRMPNSLKY